MTSKFLYRVFGTCVVLCVAIGVLAIILSFGHHDFNWSVFSLTYPVAAVAGFSLVGGIIASIWEN